MKKVEKTVKKEKKIPKVVAVEPDMQEVEPAIIEPQETIYNQQAEEVIPVQQLMEESAPEIPDTVETIVMIPERKDEIIPGQIKKMENVVHTVLIIKDGSLDVGELADLDKKNYFYRIHSRIPGFTLIDYDKTDMVPIVKDILNRQNTFIEIKYLKFILIL